MSLFDKKVTVQDLPELNQKWSNCRKCPLRIGDNLVCPGIGHQAAQVMIVGQSPTIGEAGTGKMMQDRGGQEIRQWFSEIAPDWGMSDADLYFTNCVKCPSIVRMNFNKPLSFIDAEGNLQGEVVPAKVCGSYLEDEIKLIKPKLIISIGGTALNRFADADQTKKIPRKLDKARKRIWSYNGYRFVAVTMPTRLSEPNEELGEDKEFLRQIFSMKNPVFKPAVTEIKVKSLEEDFLDVDKCKSCALSETAGCRVYGTGNTKADILFVGEAPGAQENETGIPFVGPAGQLFRESLREVGIDHKRIYICNTVKCWPGDGNPTPTEEQVAACISHLQTQIKQVEPKIIVALGAVALAALTKLPRRLGPVRGKTQRCWFSNAKVIPTWHPSYVLRDINRRSENKSPVKKEFMQDLETVRKLSEES